MEVNKRPEFLYHYTSIKTLKYILKDRTIRFNSLQNVDDLNEVESLDIDSIGKLTFVSCWTDRERENAGLWNMYADNMKGVRIKLPVHCLSEIDDEYVEEQLEAKGLKIQWNGRISIPSDKKTIIFYDRHPINFYQLRGIVYTEDNKKLYPKVIKLTEKGTGIDQIALGEHKMLEWDFQSEWRYIIQTRLKSVSEKSSAEEIKNKIEEFTDIPEAIYVHIEDECFGQMEIMLGPGTTKEDRIKVQSLINMYNKDAKLIDSNLKGRIRIEYDL